MNRLATPFRVGIVVILGAAAFVVMLSFLSKQRFSPGQTIQLYATFNDASGLGDKSRVQIAGIEVGIVDKIDLTPDAKARVTLRVRKDVPLYEDARIVKRSASLLGDFLLDIFPGTPTKRRLVDGDTIERAVNQPGMDDVFAALGDVTRDIQGVTHGLKDLLSSDEVGSIKNIIRSMNKVAEGLDRTISKAGGRLDTILGDTAHLTTAVRALADAQGDNVQHILVNVRAFTEQANKVVAGIDQLIGDNSDQLRQSVAGIKTTLDELQRALKGAEGLFDSSTKTVDDAHKLISDAEAGKGTLGKLLTDDSIANNLNGTLGGLGKILSPLANLHLDARLEGEVHYRPLLPAAYNRPWLEGGVALRIITDPTFYYGIDVLNDPRGSTTQQVVQIQNTTSGTSSSNTSTTLNQLVTQENAWKVSAYVAKRLGPIAFRAGLMENTGGVGVDAYLADDHVRLMVDAFDFDDPLTPIPRLRAQGQFSFFDHFYLSAGVDDIANIKPVLQDGHMLVGIDGFLGGGVIVTDDDMVKMLKAAGAH